VETLDFDAVDRCFAKMAAAGFAALIAVAVWMWPAIHTSAGFSHQRASHQHASAQANARL
jgi:hypothetical protein